MALNINGYTVSATSAFVLASKPGNPSQPPSSDITVSSTE
jgi:hypothetical protein